jgi:AraC family transcriptional regulator
MTRTEPASTASAADPIEPQRFADGDALIVAGLGKHHGATAIDDIPEQWKQFAPHIGRVPGQKNEVAYGVVSGGDQSGFDYLAGVAIGDATQAGKQFTVLTLPPRRYAVFFHDGNVSRLHAFCERIWTEWVPRAEKTGMRTAHAPFFERYDDRFDPRTGNGGVEVWIPLEK